MKQLLFGLFLGLGLALVIAFFSSYSFNGSPIRFISPIISDSPSPTPKLLLAFTFDNLSKREYFGSLIKLEEEIEGNSISKKEIFKTYIFSYQTLERKVTGMVNIPQDINTKMPVIIMIRGYVDQSIYNSGMGTQRTAEVLAATGFITLAPDFLGFGDSDMPEQDIWWERLSRPVQVLDLISSVKSLPQADPERIGIWAHSNGGQIALSILEISGKPYPTTLWAPVSKPFPYSVLYYTNEADDEGESLRSELARFEKDYHSRDYSITDYFNQIKAPIQLHQGTADDAVPIDWSNNLAQALEESQIDIEYYTYPGADHNLLPSWNIVIARDIEFFRKELHY